MDIAILDDEIYYLNEISCMIRETFSNDTIHCFQHVQELLAYKGKVDLLLLDIEMPEVDGVVFAKENSRNFPYVVFVSSHTERVFNAFDMNVVGFIPKQSLKENLIPCIRDLKQKLENTYLIKLKTSVGVYNVRLSDIVYIESKEDCIYMTTNKEEVRLTIVSLSKLKDNLNSSFCFISRNCLVNLHDIKVFQPETHTIIMNNGSKLKVSDRRWKPLLYAYNEVVNVL